MIDEDLPDDVLAFIEEGSLIPVLGPELLQIQVDGTHLYRHIAEGLAQRYNLPAPQTGYGELDDVVRAYLKGDRRDVSALYRPIWDILSKSSGIATPPALLHRSAAARRSAARRAARTDQGAERRWACHRHRSELMGLLASARPRTRERDQSLADAALCPRPVRGAVHSWRTDSGRGHRIAQRFRQSRRKRHGEESRGPAFSPDMSMMASASDDETIILWALPSGVQLGPPLSVHGDAVRDLAFSADGKWLVSAGLDKQVVLWSLEQLRNEGAVGEFDDRQSLELLCSKLAGNIARDT